MSTGSTQAQLLDGKALAEYVLFRFILNFWLFITWDTAQDNTIHHLGNTKKNRSLRTQFQKQVQELKSQYDFVPHLAIVQVGAREDSSVYVRMKQQAAVKVFFYNLLNWFYSRRASKA